MFGACLTVSYVQLPNLKGVGVWNKFGTGFKGGDEIMCLVRGGRDCNQMGMCPHWRHTQIPLDRMEENDVVCNMYGKTWKSCRKNNLVREGAL